MTCRPSVITAPGEPTVRPSSRICCLRLNSIGGCRLSEGARRASPYIPALRRQNLWRRDTADGDQRDHGRPSKDGGRLTGLGARLFGQSAEMGALPALYAATDPAAQGGTFIGPGGVGQLRGYPKPVTPGRLALDEVLARRLWDVSTELTGVRFEGLDDTGRPV